MSTDKASPRPWDDDYSPRLIVGRSLAQTTEMQDVLVTEDEHQVIVAILLSGVGTKMAPLIVRSVNQAEHVEALMEALDPGALGLAFQMELAAHALTNDNVKAGMDVESLAAYLLTHASRIRTALAPFTEDGE